MSSPIRQRLGRAVEPQILFPILALIGLSALWGSTAVLIKFERASAERTALASTAEFLETYHAQVVRAVQGIEHTLGILQYAFEHFGYHGDFERLGELGLLPPDLLFVVSIADREGNVMLSTRPLPEVDINDREQFLAHLQDEELSVGIPQRDSESGEWVLRFSRRLENVDGSFAGVATVWVGADFFVSSYEAGKLGEDGVLGILGTDGIFRARRTGDLVAHGEAVDYATALQHDEEGEIRVALSVNSWDGIRRYVAARELYDVPLTVVVGLSEDEQLAPSRRNARVYLWRATAASAVVILVLALFGQMAWRLAEGRKAALAAQLEHAKQIEYLALHDGLTGLANRSLFSKVLQRNIQRGRRSGAQLAVLFLDLDRFKHINDTLGHEVGDQLLQDVAKRLKDCLRETDMVARFGGDEFVVLLTDLTWEAYAATVAEKILSLVAQPFNLLGQEFRVTASVGITTYPQDGLDEQTLIKNADIAMYKAKEQGKNNYQFYSQEMVADSLERLSLEASLRNALEREEFELYYQPKRGFQDARITGMEALLRWRHPDLGIVAPLRFIAVAEETGLILPLGKWVLKTACRQNVEWQKAGLPKLPMAVNLSPLQFRDERLLPDLRSILQESGLEPRLLELEISEALLMGDVEHTLRVLAELKEIGVKVAIDDFGLGYTMLSSLRQFPLDTIKIDRTFIRKIDHLSEDQALTEAIIALGRSLSLTVVAQGVETIEQAEFLRRHACDELQGFFFDQPLPASPFAELLADESGVAGDVEKRAAEPAKEPG